MKKCCSCKIIKELYEFNQGQKSCKQCRKLICKKSRLKTLLKDNERTKKWDKIYKKEFPWKITLKSIKQRCYNKNNKRYYRYGGRGIKCLITEEELKELWFRDKAYEMERPSIDRDDNDGNYEYSNCQYIDSRKHAKKSYKERSINTKGQFTHVI